MPSTISAHPPYNIHHQYYVVFQGGDREAPGQRSVLHRARQGGPSRLLRLHHLGRRQQVSITFEISAKFVLKYTSSSRSERKFSHVYSTGCMGKTSEILKVVCEGFSAALASSKAFHQVCVGCWDVYYIRALQGWAKKWAPGCENFSAKLSHMWQATAGPKFTKPGAHLLAHPTTFDTVLLTSRWVGLCLNNIL